MSDIEVRWAEALRAFGIDPDDPKWFQHVIDVRTQDEKNGAAWRRLREALDEVGPNELTMRISNGGTIVIQAAAGDGPMDGAMYLHDVTGRGATLAEAADACREALEGKG